MKKNLISFGMAALILAAITVAVITGCADGIPANPFLVKPFNPEVPLILIHPQDEAYVIGEQAAALTVTAEVNDGGTLSYQWYRNADNNNEEGTAINDETEASCIPPTDTQGTMYYYVKVTNTQKGKKATAVSDTAKITVYREATIIRSVDVTVTAPAKSDAPVTTATVDDEGYTCGAVSWSPDHDPFRGNTKYTATVTLTANEYYLFAVELDATINNDDAVVTHNTGEAVTLSLEFDATLDRIVSGIAIESQPSKLSYTHGDTLDLDGLVVTLTHDDGTSEDVELAHFGTNISTHPANGAVLHRPTNNSHPVVVSFGELTANTNNLTVSTKALTVTTAAHTRSYDGTTTANGVSVTLGGIVGDDDVSVDTVSAVYTNAAAGTQIVNISAVTLTGTAAGNYTVTLPDGSITVTGGITKANPTVTWPTGLTATYGQTLSNISLPGNGTGSPAGTFTWTTPSTSVGNAGTRSHSMTFTPTDTANYNTLTQNVNITVNKANPTVTWPTGLTAAYGQTLANITLPGNGTGSPAGAFTWTTPSTSVGALGTRSFGMTFTPTDTTNYNTQTQNVSITVNAKPVTITVGAPTRTLIPFDSADTQYGTTAAFNVTVSGLVGSDTITVNIAANSYGLSLSDNTGIGSAGKNVTLIYNGTTAVTQTTALSVGLTVTVSSNYTFSGSPTISPTVIDGQAEARAIPVTQANIAAFNTYANTTNGLTRHYKLMGNITLNGTNNWTAIGTNLNRFTGSFNGQGYTITNLTINSTSYYQGMFANIGSGGVVQNLGLVGVSVSGNSSTGGVVGNNSGTVQNCYATGNVSGGDGDGVGGVVGNNSGTVQNCYATGSVSNIYRIGVGGVVGDNSGTVQNCYATGNVSGGSGIGGVVGVNRGTVQNSVALNPSVSKSGGGDDMGRVVGYNYTTLTNNYARSNMTVQYNWNGTTGTNKTISAGLTTSDGANAYSGIGTGNYNDLSFWIGNMGWDFTNVWEWNSTTGLPILRGFSGAQNHTVQ